MCVEAVIVKCDWGVSEGMRIRCWLGICVKAFEWDGFLRLHVSCNCRHPGHHISVHSKMILLKNLPDAAKKTCNT